MKKRGCYRRYAMLLCSILVAESVMLGGCGRQQWEKNITEEEIVIEGLEGEYDFLFLTDTHMIVQDKEDPKEVQEYAASRYPGFRNREGVSSKDQFAEWAAYAREEELDGILLGGDIIDYPSQANINYLRTQLGEMKIPYLYTLGNHDWTYPWEYMTATGRETYLPMLDDLLMGDPAVHTLEYEEFRIVAVDNSTNQINDAAMQECERLLTGEKPVILMLHVPLITQSVLGRAREVWGKKKGVVLGAGNYGGIYPNDTSRRFMELVTAADSPVEAILAGHVHFYDKDYVEGDKDVLQIVGDAGFNGSGVRLHIKGNI